jgi:MurNAc alpha-1-phosphate uridylyltransferase
MKALIFAAGRGERMRPLSDATPKPLLLAGGKPLIVWHIEKLAALGVRDIVVNTSWLADRFEPALGDGARWGIRLHYSYEGPEPLETGGGMLQALEWLGVAPFLAVNGDIWTDFDFGKLPDEPDGLAHLLLVNNPPQHPRGDFALAGDGRVHSDGEPRLTFAGIGLYRPDILDNWRAIVGDTPGVDNLPPRFKLAPLLRAAMARGQIGGERHAGVWTDVGTPERLAQLNASL